MRASFALDSKVTISKTDCLAVLEHQSHLDVEYQPGINIRGKKVKKAELFGSQKLGMQDEYTFDLSLNIAKKYGIENKNISSVMLLGNIKLRDGELYFNHGKMNSRDTQAIRKKCRSLVK